MAKPTNPTNSKNTNARQKSEKLVTAGSDGSAGFLMGGKPDREKVIEAAMRGAMQAVLASIASVEVDADGTVDNYISDEDTSHPQETIQQLDTQVSVDIDQKPVTIMMDADYPKDVDALQADQYSKALEPSQPMNGVPNYHKPDDGSTKVCSTCRFYQKIDERTGQCVRFAFTALADHTCDVWEVLEIKTNGVDSTRMDPVDKSFKAEEEIPDSAHAPTDLPAKYQGIDFTVTKNMAKNAWNAAYAFTNQQPGKQNMSQDDLDRSYYIVRREVLPPETWRRMLGYFADHEKNKFEPDWDETSAPWQIWQSWGGDDAFEKAKSVIKQMDEADTQADVKMMSASKSLGRSTKSVVPVVEVANPEGFEEGAAVVDRPIRSSDKKQAEKKIKNPKDRNDTDLPGEVINEKGVLETLPNTPFLSADETPELSRPHGRRKAILYYLPAERVYSKTMRSLGEIVKGELVNNEPLYTMKLLDRFGVVFGQAIVHQDDLTPRSMKAMKRMEEKSIELSLTDQIEDILDTLCTMRDSFSDAQPLSPETLGSIVVQCKDALSSEPFQTASSDMDMRRYVRLLQEMEHSITAAAHLIHISEELGAEAGDNTVMIVKQGQDNAYHHICDCIDRAEQILTTEGTYDVDGELQNSEEVAETA